MRLAVHRDADRALPQLAVHGRVRRLLARDADERPNRQAVRLCGAVVAGVLGGCGIMRRETQAALERCPSGARATPEGRPGGARMCCM